MCTGKITVFLVTVAILYCGFLTVTQAKDIGQRDFPTSAESSDDLVSMKYGEAVKGNETDVDEVCKCRNGNCSMQGNKEVCVCYPGFGKIDGSTCQECDCGKNSNCTFDVGFWTTTKKCICPQGFHDEHGTCKVCTCENGKCVTDGSKESCTCNPGFGEISKLKCKACECGANFSCTFDVGIFSDGKKCICPPGFHERDGVCKECTCDNGKCVLNGDKDACDCNPGFGKVSDFKCKACECGGNFSCTFDVGILSDKKKCICPPGFHEKDGVCKECTCKNGKCVLDGTKETCDCNPGFGRISDLECKACGCGEGFNCTFDVGIFSTTKKCICPPGFHEENGACKVCTCENGKCVTEGNKESCVCNPGFGKIADFKCKACECGQGYNCTFDVGLFSTSKKCLCPKGFLDEHGVCKECNCGDNGRCKINSKGTKACDCNDGYFVRDGICEDCACGFNKTKCKLVDNVKYCECPKGYEDAKGVCEDIDECKLEESCPNSTKCINSPGSYECVCKEGYEPIRNNSDPKVDGCQDINECLNPKTCHNSTTTCVNLPGTYKCVCRVGFQPLNLYADPRYTRCRENDASWMTVNIVLGVVLSLLVVALLVVFFLKRRRQLQRSDSTQEIVE